MANAATRRHERRRASRVLWSGATAKKCLRAILIMVAVSAFSVLWLLPKTGDPMMAVFVGWTVLLGPAVVFQGIVDPDRRRQRS